MTVLLVLTFVTFLLIDHFHSRKQVVLPPAVQPVKREALPRLAPSLVGGFHVPEKLRFHPGHTWALSESPSLVRIGLDEFASKLTASSSASRCRGAVNGSGKGRRCGRCIGTARRSTWSLRLRAAWPTSTKRWCTIQNWR